MDTTEFETISDTELEQVTGGIYVAFLFGQPILQGSTPAESAYLSALDGQLKNATAGALSAFNGLGGAAGVAGVARAGGILKFG
jgi:bacteriocin-like protein